jgi:[calcium/calmodulin-dependent protein kinase] kinase
VDDVLKIVDFGVSEMFEKSSEMRTAKPAGSPAFLPPELCVAKHGDVSGKAADLWSMGVTLYCLRYGRIPFERDSVLEMYGAIKTETPKFPPDENEQFLDLMSRLLEKNPEKRITMAELRVSIRSSAHSMIEASSDLCLGTPMGNKGGRRPSSQPR